MKLDKKNILTIILLGTFFYVFNYQVKKLNISREHKQILIDKKINSAKLLSPKVYTSSLPAKNGLEAGSNWRSR